MSTRRPPQERSPRSLLLFDRKTLSDGDRLEVAGAPVKLKVNRRARRVSLRLNRTKREVVSTAP